MISVGTFQKLLLLKNKNKKELQSIDLKNTDYDYLEDIDENKSVSSQQKKEYRGIIGKNYRAFALKYHPDKKPDTKNVEANEYKEENFKNLTTAYENLLNKLNKLNKLKSYEHDINLIKKENDDFGILCKEAFGNDACSTTDINSISFNYEYFRTIYRRILLHIIHSSLNSITDDLKNKQKLQDISYSFAKDLRPLIDLMHDFTKERQEAFITQNLNVRFTLDNKKSPMVYVFESAISICRDEANPTQHVNNVIDLLKTTQDALSCLVNIAIDSIKKKDIEDEIEAFSWRERNKNLRGTNKWKNHPSNFYDDCSKFREYQLKYQKLTHVAKFILLVLSITHLTPTVPIILLTCYLAAKNIIEKHINDKKNELLKRSPLKDCDEENLLFNNKNPEKLNELKQKIQNVHNGYKKTFINYYKTLIQNQKSSTNKPKTRAICLHNIIKNSA